MCVEFVQSGTDGEVMSEYGRGGVLVQGCFAGRGGLLGGLGRLGRVIGGRINTQGGGKTLMSTSSTSFTHPSSSPVAKGKNIRKSRKRSSNQDISNTRLQHKIEDNITPTDQKQS